MLRVVKTHRLPLNAAHNLMSPTFPDAALESRVTIGPKALRSMIEHFPFGKSSKSDPQLIWNFRDTEVQLRSLETAVDAKGRAQLSTELTISADEFDEYDVLDTPMTIAFHLKEFNLSLEIRFTNPDSPLYIDVGGDLADTLFVIAASQLQLVSPRGSQARQGSADAQGNSRKRPLEEDNHNHHVYPDRNMPVVEREREKRPVKPMRVVHEADRASIAREMQPPLSAHEPQPSWAVLTAAQQQYQDLVDDIGGAPPSQPLYRFASQTSQREGHVEKEPLFLPASQLSQLPPDAEAAIIASGLGIEHMTAEELEDMLEGDAEEVEFVSQRSHLPGSIKEESPESPNQAQEEDQEWQMDEQVEDYGDVAYGQQQDSFELIDDVEMEPTQKDGGTRYMSNLYQAYNNRHHDEWNRVVQNSPRQGVMKVVTSRKPAKLCEARGAKLGDAMLTASDGVRDELTEEPISPLRKRSLKSNELFFRRTAAPDARPLVRVAPAQTEGVIIA
ncbi:hypothetical protein ACG7TL_005664 [Trametes sanguinea]